MEWGWGEGRLRIRWRIQVPGGKNVGHVLLGTTDPFSPLPLTSSSTILERVLRGI